MPKDAQVERTFFDGWRAHVLPVAAAIGFVELAPRATPKKRASLVAGASRTLDDATVLELLAWCPFDRPAAVSLRLSRRDPASALAPEVALPCPISQLRAIDAGVRELLPHASLERMAHGIAFLGGAWAAALPALARVVPALAGDVERASASFAPQVERAREAWRVRHARGPIEEVWVDAAFVFAGAQLVSVDAADARVQFKLPAGHGVTAATALSCGGWWTNAAGQRRPCRLRADARTYHFDLDGSLVKIDNA